ncbi:MAG: hypothetical protein IH934_00835 [Nanoarchaeota archaeon]|nr:hypothetical protein [Nanoarchaeota archaeon]
MKKRGQGEVIKYVIIALTILAITFFGYKSLAVIQDKTCNAELAKFQIDLKNLDKTVKFGNVKEFTYRVPCNSNEILFFDLNQRDKIISSLTNLNPLIIDSIKSKVEKNVFVVRNNKILSSFYAGNLDIEFPNYICFLPKFEKIDFIVEGKGTSVSVVGGCLQPECTYFPVQLIEENVVGILNEAVGFDEEPDSDCGKQGKSSCPSDVKDEFVKFLRTKENVNIFRKYEYCKETGKTNIEILIKPGKVLSNKEFRFYESIPKDCIDDLKKYLSTQIKGEVSIKYDPLIIWSFDDIKEEKKLRYILDTLLSDDCRESIEGIGISNLLEEDVEVTLPSDAEIDDKIKQYTNLNLEIEDITLHGANAKHEINLRSKTTYNGDKKHLKYSIVGTDENDVIKCNIKKDDKLLRCESEENEQSSLTITVQVTNGEVTALDSFNVNVISICADECSSQAKQCVDQTNYQECILVEGCFKWSPSISCGANFECVNDGQCKEIVTVIIPQAASLEFKVTIKNKEPSTLDGKPAFKYFYDLELNEVNGVGVDFNMVTKTITVAGTFEERGKGWISGKCGSTFLEGGSSCFMEDRWFRVTFSNDIFTETWIGIDSNGNTIAKGYTISAKDFS